MRIERSLAALTTNRKCVAPDAIASAAAMDSIRTPRPRRWSSSAITAASSAVDSPGAQAHIAWPTIVSSRVATKAVPVGHSIRSSNASRGGVPIAVWNRK
ncbi:hypothetical protein OHB24_19265 [Kribbella sp. NBC_00482]